MSLGDVRQRDDVEVIVIDNNSGDDTVPMLEAEFPEVHVIVNDSNRGVAPARNQGLEQATGELVMLLDNDTIASVEAVDALVAYMDTHPDVGLAGCRLVDAYGNTQDSAKPYPGIRSKIRNVLGLKPLQTRLAVDNDGATEPEYVIGACQVMRHTTIERVGLLDEAIFYGPEDADYCLRVRAAGMRVKYLPWISITHLWQRATTHNLLSPLARRHIAGLWHLYRKHRRWL